MDEKPSTMRRAREAPCSSADRLIAEAQPSHDRNPNLHCEVVAAVVREHDAQGRVIGSDEGADLTPPPPLP
jgi:hypothetical protein